MSTYHIASKMIPLEVAPNGMSFVTLPDIPDHVDVIVGESMPNEFGGTIIITFVEVTEDEVTEDEAAEPEPSKLTLVED